MAKPMIEIEVFDPLYTEERPSDINLKKLSELLGINQVSLAKALKINPTILSKSPYAKSTNVTLKKWMVVFNQIISIIAETEPKLDAEEIRLKMQKWIKIPRPDFSGESALDYMLKGKINRVANLLEQIKA